ncbi:histone-fold containing protein [Coleophoma crateriformis]|uniref:TBP-associated factor 6 n=1 Tax=Coleophoma crateriformis TaxID=565419 RepID=A0A3D8T982_9HELO|nr:histone-fold containing protein [Coleophoma crateriformis]
MATEQKLFWNSDNVRDVAESVGISSLNEEAVRALSQEVEYRLGQVITEAMRFMHQSKRTVLSTQDISQALKVLDVEPLYGYESTRPLRFGEASLGPGQPLFYIEDEEVDFEKLINAPLPKVPRDMSFTAHWLAVEGVQPSIPQNPTTAEARSTELIPKGPGANPSLTALAGNDNVTFKPLVKHIVSKELTLFFDKVRKAILDEDPDPDVVLMRHSALESVRSDPGLHQLVPYFIQFIADKVTHSLNNTFVLRQMMELAAAVIANPTLHVDPYVTSLIPGILTCLIGKSLGVEGPDMMDQYALRDFSSSLLSKIATKYAQTTQELRPRLGRTLLKHFLDYDRSLGTHYGAIRGIADLGGTEAVRELIIACLGKFDCVIEKGIKQRGEDDLQVQMLIGCIMKVISTVAESGNVLTNGANGDADNEQVLIDYLGPHIGKRVAALHDHRLNKAIMEVKSREEREGAE